MSLPRVEEPTPDQFRALFENAPGLFLVLRPDLTIVAVTEGYLAATMTRRDEIIGRHLFDVFPDNPSETDASGVQNLSASLAIVLQQKTEHRMAVQRYPVRKPPEEGGEFEVSYWSPLNSPVLDRTGNVQFIIHRVEDVTDLVKIALQREEQDARAHDLEAEILKKTGELGTLTALLKAERQARHTEDEFRQLADAMPQLAWMAKRDGWIYWYNQRWYEYTGTTPESMAGWGWQSVHDPESLPSVLERWGSSIATGKPFEMVFPLRGADGRFRPFLTRSFPMKDDTGKVIRWFGTNTDISEQMDAEAKRRRALEERYRWLIESISDYAIFTLDTKGFVTSWNPGAQRIKQYSADEIIGEHFSKFYIDVDREQRLPARVLDTALKTGHYEGEGWRKRKDGSLFWASLVVTPIRNETGELIGFSKITRDITERKQLIDRLSQYSKELELRIQERDQSYADLETFSYSVAHDLRTPLRTIQGFADVIMEDFRDQIPQDARDHLKRVTDAAERMNQLIDDLLQYSKIAHGEIRCSRVNIEKVLLQVMQQLGPEARAKTSVQVEPGLAAIAHEPTLIQSLLNLVTNALKFYPAGQDARAEVKAFRREDTAVVSVRDHGIGIDPQYKEKIFRVFERLHTIQEYPGTGIGLAIVERGIARMGGRVRVQSAPGKGSTFTVEVQAA
jgi:PAS domain S-box-containing protein